MGKIIRILSLKPEAEPQQVLDALPDLGEEVLPHVWITALASPSAFPNEPLQDARKFMFEISDELTPKNSAFVSSQIFNLLVSDLRLGVMSTFKSVRIGVRRPDSGQRRGTVEILGR